MGTSLTAVAGFETAITFLSVLLLTRSHVTGITLKSAFPLHRRPCNPDLMWIHWMVGQPCFSEVFACDNPAFDVFQQVRTPPGVCT